MEDSDRRRGLPVWSELENVRTSPMPLTRAWLQSLGGCSLAEDRNLARVSFQIMPPNWNSGVQFVFESGCNINATTEKLSTALPRSLTNCLEEFV